MRVRRKLRNGEDFGLLSIPPPGDDDCTSHGTAMSLCPANPRAIVFYREARLS